MQPLPDLVTIRVNDSKRDTNTNTVPITIMEDNIYIAGNLPSTLTLAKNCKVLIAKNIDIEDRLVNAVIGSVQEICINDSDPLVELYSCNLEVQK